MKPILPLLVGLVMSLFAPISWAESELSHDNAVLAPPFSLPGISQQVNLADYRGKVVLVDFWASWCSPCIRSFPWMNEMLAKYAQDGFEIIAINMDQEQQLADKFLQRYPNQLTIAFDPNGQVAEQYQVMGLPNSFIINREGQIVYKHVGFRLTELDKYEAEIKTLLQQ